MKAYRKISVLICLLGLFVFFSASNGTASTIGGAYGANYYEFVTADNPYIGDKNSWWTAGAAAINNTHNGVHGHLATITSQEENDFLFSLVPSGAYTGFAGAWLGGKYPEGWLAGPESGQAFTYSNFGGSEPNNSGYAYMNIGTLYAGIYPGEWADDSGDQGFPSSSDPVIGYFIEYESAVPIPGTAWLLGSVILGIVGVRRKNKKQ